MRIEGFFKKQFVLAITFVFFGVSANAQERLSIDLGDRSRSMHPDESRGVIFIEPAPEDYLFMLFDICDAVGIDCLIYPMVGEIDNALAYQEDDETRLIVYDRNWSRKIGDMGASSVIAHEIGHHYCQHLTTRSDISAYNAEAEADRFMGYAMAHLSPRLSEVISTMEKLGIEAGSDSHPPISSRVMEIAKGYYVENIDEICNGKDPT